MDERPKMPVHTIGHRHYEVVLGPCPGCELWQLDYTDLALATYFEDDLGFAAVLENVLREHYGECDGLQALIGPV